VQDHRPREAIRRAESRIRTNEEEEEKRRSIEEEERRCLAFASRCGNDFAVSSDREAKRASKWGASPPHPPLFFLFSLFFSFEGRASVQDQKKEKRGERRSGVQDHDTPALPRRRKGRKVKKSKTKRRGRIEKGEAMKRARR
jgi:hypothetical protein